MLRPMLSIIPVLRNFTIALIPLMALSAIVLPLTGCSDDGSRGPNIASLSTPADAASGEGAPSDSNPAATESTAAGEEPSTDLTASVAEDIESQGDIVEPVDGEEDLTISVTSTPTGATARVTWDAFPDPTVSNYYVYYGKQSSGEPGSCSYEASQSVEASPATISGLEPNTVYFFAISAFGESESPCSSEALVVTPPAQG